MAKKKKHPLCGRYGKTVKRTKTSYSTDSWSQAAPRTVRTYRHEFFCTASGQRFLSIYDEISLKYVTFKAPVGTCNYDREFYRRFGVPPSLFKGSCLTDSDTDTSIDELPKEKKRTRRQRTKRQRKKRPPSVFFPSGFRWNDLRLYLEDEEGDDDLEPNSNSGDTPPDPKPTPPAPSPNVCNVETNPDACTVVPCDDSEPDGVTMCIYTNSANQCVLCDELPDFYPTPPYMDEDSSLSEEDAEQAWRQFILEQDMAKLTAGPGGSTTMGIPDDFIEKKLGPLIRPTSSSVSKGIRDQVSAGLAFIHPFLTKEKSIEELMPAGPGPYPHPDDNGGGQMVPTGERNPDGPVISTTQFTGYHSIEGVGDDW